MPSTTISYTIDSSVAELSVAALCAQYNYSLKIPDPNDPGTLIDNPVSPETFAQQQIVAFVKDTVGSYLMRQATEAAQASAQASISALNASPVDIAVTVNP